MEPGVRAGPLTRLEFEQHALALADEVYGIARGLVGSGDEAERLVQETYSQAFRSWRSSRSEGSLRDWLVGVLTALDAERGRSYKGPGAFA